MQKRIAYIVAMHESLCEYMGYDFVFSLFARKYLQCTNGCQSLQSNIVINELINNLKKYTYIFQGNISINSILKRIV